MSAPAPEQTTKVSLGTVLSTSYTKDEKDFSQTCVIDPIDLRNGKMEIIQSRLDNQQITVHKFEQPAEVVSWLGAVQAQDYLSAKWALGLRLPGATDTTIEQAFTKGSILRTHLMRPTWHFVTPADIRWMLHLTAPRVHLRNSTYYRNLGLDQATFTRSQAALEGALQGGKQFTRAELETVFQRNGVKTESTLRLAYILMHAELEGIICSGPRRGKQFTYMLLAERAPQAKTITRQEAFAELARRYFFSHGPATVQDFMWWSGLTKAEASDGLEEIKAELNQEFYDGKTYWFSPAEPAAIRKAYPAYLLPIYDEYGSYKDRSAVFNPEYTNKLVFSHLIVINGRVAGTWKRTIKKNSVFIESNFFNSPNSAEKLAFAGAARRYGEFIGLPVVLG